MAMIVIFGGLGGDVMIIMICHDNSGNILKSWDC